MALDFSILEFPNNAVQIIKAALKNIQTNDADTTYDKSLRVFGRPLNEGDGDLSVSVVPANWIPDPRTKEMIGFNSEPIIQTYTIVIQSIIIRSDEEDGIIASGKLASRIRDTLYRDPALGVVLRDLSFTYDYTHLGRPDSVEKVMKFDVVRQNFINNETNQAFYYLSETEFSITTEVNPRGM